MGKRKKFMTNWDACKDAGEVLGAEVEEFAPTLPSKNWVEALHDLVLEWPYVDLCDKSYASN